MKARRKAKSETKNKGKALVTSRHRRKPADGRAARSKVWRKTTGEGARKRTNGKAVPELRAAGPAELAVELGIRVADGSHPEAKRIAIAGIVRPPRRGANDVFPGVKDRETIARRVARGTRPERLARLLAAIAHPQRLVILLKLLAGEATHKLLTKATGLKAGPLYYHLRELREAGLIGPRVRDLYVLTRQGRRLILAVVATERLCK